MIQGVGVHFFAFRKYGFECGGMAGSLSATRNGPIFYKKKK